MAKHWVHFGVGFWIMVSPWLLGFSNIFLAKWSNVMFGLALVVMNAWIIFGEKGRELGNRG